MISKPFVKINLGLDVLRRRDDGFHDIDTVFVPYHGICDTLEIVRGDEGSETVDSLRARYSADRGQVVQSVSDDAKVMVTVAKEDGIGWNPLEDLTVKAFRILERDFGIGPVKIFLEKTAPVGAGLGGGSSDAAFALKMLDGIFGLGMSREAMARYAASLGSDCAFFLYDRPMSGRGRGEILSEFHFPEDFHDRYEIKVVVPEGVAVSTADAYKGIIPHIPDTPLLSRLSRPVECWKDSVINAFEETVFKKYPVLSEVKRSLYDTGAVYASMSGSGSSFFAIYEADGTSDS